MPPPPPPPPPMPPMGRGAGGPPPPPMLGKSPGGKAAGGAGRGALLGDISKGMKLKKVTQVNDRSAPITGKVSDGPSAAPMGAPAIPGMGKPPAVPGLAPPVPGGGNRGRSNSDTGDGGGAAPPQLAGIFAGGMPKLRKAGGVNTGADQSHAPYLSDPESNRGSAPKPPRGAAPRPPGLPPSAPPAPPGGPPARPGINALRGQDSRPNSVASSISGKPKPPPPIGKKPPMPPPSSRKPSGLAPPPPTASPARAPPIPGGAPPPPPPPASTSPRPTGVPPPPPLPPPSPAPRAPARSTPPPPPSDDEYDPYKYPAPAPPPPPPNGHTPSLAETAARNAFGRASPAAPPPPPPAAPPSAPAPPPPPSAAPSRQASQTPLRSMMDPSSYTLSNGGSSIKSPTHSGGGSREKGRVRPIQDLRWRFQDEGQFPRPREFTNGPKKYRAGRGSSVPLDLSAYE
ncbi:hypothetical protein A1F94_000372 [Pyrenophora tritici-repentis]|uniref:Periplasmic protein TonB n=2 Tax=Pyrenophora tritici-repentis TaxID=45151 RepID=A0A2W1CWN3_9PLEO|nr:uncharacterized protein PTRG_00702 [Pyrenophora tritici-repentis Pt-1C-BFP]KAA8625321.1 hypothetical protein PtrV1_01001 [Pyrenophora tritici-repentis]EDU40140.1 conserved hypothetical protein [Pyrenophora tritici-repentis Pt-1C-BFP]KAF7453720.1 hypothetical protein A1F99_009780 [Pyrenophora tritici-repentis]KAF7576809.1 Periplasmic protein TonB [Pyrenophora tritici-repentis]KAG9387480.1 hypothetical protein A1F94_000372 [Pyrenophora tritici-repentis]